MMISTRAKRLTAVLFLVVLACRADASSRRETPLVKAVQHAKTGVVNIHSEKTSYSTDTVFPSTKGRKVNGMGTGIVIDERGYIVTNYHVVEGVDSLRVTLVDGSNYDARTLSYDKKSDLAIIKIETSKKLSVMEFGTSSDLMLGESVIAVGNAFGYEHTVTSGIVSALSRDVEVNESQSYYNLIQTDASINPGNSGGPLLNLDGKVVGINVAIRAGAQRIGFAIPIDDARQVIARLINVSQMDKTRHGLVSQDVKNAEEQKLIVTGVEDDSPAGKAGLTSGDVILKVGDVAVADRVDFERALLGHKVGDKFEVSYLREGETKTTELSLSAYDPKQVVHVNAPTIVRGNNDVETPAERIWQTVGIRIVPLDDPTVTQGTIYEGGVRITSIRPGSPAALGGMQTGDVLVGLHRWATMSEDNLLYIIEQEEVAQAPQAVTFYLLRQRVPRPLNGKLNLSTTLRK